MLKLKPFGGGGGTGNIERRKRLVEQVAALAPWVTFVEYIAGQPGRFRVRAGLKDDLQLVRDQVEYWSAGFITALRHDFGWRGLTAAQRKETVAALKQAALASPQAAEGLAVVQAMLAFHTKRQPVVPQIVTATPDSNSSQKGSGPSPCL